MKPTSSNSNAYKFLEEQNLLLVARKEPFPVHFLFKATPPPGSMVSAMLLAPGKVEPLERCPTHFHQDGGMTNVLM